MTASGPILGSASEIHVPVLLAEAVAALAPRDGGIYVDGTFGAGGYSRAILARAACRVVAIDRDPAAIARAGQEGTGGLTALEGRFGELDRLVAGLGIAAVDGVALDLGVSSPQLDDPERGFSFRGDGPLDMRMGRDGPTAADLVNETAERDLADLIFRLGDERHARSVARAICRARPLHRTHALATVVRAAVPPSRDGIDPATRTFQALRMAVNDELGELGRGLVAAERILAPGGRLAVVAFHSLEDRAVKTFLRARSEEAPRGSRHLPESAGARRAASFRLLSRRPIGPGESEIARNPRARSARLRAAERTAAPPWPSET